MDLGLECLALLFQTDDTLPTGKRTRTIVYDAPFDTCDREEDYGTVWAEFERQRQQA